MTLESICDNRFCPVFNFFTEPTYESAINCPTCHTGALWLNNRMTRHIPKDLRCRSWLDSQSMTKGEHQRILDMANRRHKIVTTSQSIRRIVVTNWRNQ
jgi:hypothetical protein